MNEFIDITKIQVYNRNGLEKAVKRLNNYLQSCKDIGCIVKRFNTTNAIIYTNYGKKEMIYIKIN